MLQEQKFIEESEQIMFTHFTKEEKAVHYPDDRRAFIATKPYILVIFGVTILGIVAAAWLQYLLIGLPTDPSLSFPLTNVSDPSGFPLWLNLSHWVNFFFLVLIIRSGLSILVDHPRLYWNNGCAPETEWIRFTPVRVPKDKSWTAKEDARYISPIVGLPGYKHTIGIAMAMSPAIENRFHWYPKLFGNPQSARSIHFMVMIAYVIFIIIHVVLVAIAGLARNMNHIVMGTDDSNNSGLYIGIGIVITTIFFCIVAHWLSWNKPRSLQRANAAINGNLWRITVNRFKPKPFYKSKDISPYFWPNGKIPSSEEWKKLAANDFKDYKLKIGGLVENPMELSLEELKNLGSEQNITMHHCIQGWSGIAEWGGVPISKIVELVKPHSSVTAVAFYSFGEGLYGGYYYDTNTLGNCLKPQSILAWEMNYEPLPLVHGAPLRLRVENQLGYKMVKWINNIEFVETYKTLGKGQGGKNEDDEYFDLLADT